MAALVSRRRGTGIRNAAEALLRTFINRIRPSTATLLSQTEGGDGLLSGLPDNPCCYCAANLPLAGPPPPAANGSPAPPATLSRASIARGIVVVVVVGIEPFTSLSSSTVSNGNSSAIRSRTSAGHPLSSDATQANDMVIPPLSMTLVRATLTLLVARSTSRAPIVAAVAVVAVVIVGRSRNCTMMSVDPLLRVYHRDPWNKHLKAHPVGVDALSLPAVLAVVSPPLVLACVRPLLPRWAGAFGRGGDDVVPTLPTL